MAHDIIFFLIGLVLIVAGGNFLTDGASAVARRFNIPGLVIGLTIVAFGSSTPDLVVCLTSTLRDKSELALGDVVGANIFDLLLVVGVVALVRPIPITREMLWRDLPMAVLSSLALFFCGDDILFDGAEADIIDRTDGLMLLAFFIIFMVYTFSMVRQQRPAAAAGPPAAPQQGRGRGGMWLAAAGIAGGLAALVVGGNWLVDGASGIARRAGLSEGVIGLTVVGFGSSVPDLATSVIAAAKRQPGIALGNVVGSCIFNVFLVVGLCSTVRPLNAGTISAFDFGTLAVGALLVWLFGAIIGRRVITRGEGAVLVVVYLAYAARLVMSIVE